jgi:hypothetical protein
LALRNFVGMLARVERRLPFTWVEVMSAAAFARVTSHHRSAKSPLWYVPGVCPEIAILESSCKSLISLVVDAVASEPVSGFQEPRNPENREFSRFPGLKLPPAFGNYD